MNSLRTAPAVINADGLAEYNQDNLFWAGGEPLPPRQSPKLTARQLSLPRPQFLAAVAASEEQDRLAETVYEAMAVAGFRPVRHAGGSISITVGDEFFTIEQNTFPRKRSEA